MEQKEEHLEANISIYYTHETELYAESYDAMKYATKCDNVIKNVVSNGCSGLLRPHQNLHTFKSIQHYTGVHYTKVYYLSGLSKCYFHHHFSFN